MSNYFYGYFISNCFTCRYSGTVLEWHRCTHSCSRTHPATSDPGCMLFHCRHTHLKQDRNAWVDCWAVYTTSGSLTLTNVPVGYRIPHCWTRCSTLPGCMLFHCRHTHLKQDRNAWVDCWAVYITSGSLTLMNVPGGQNPRPLNAFFNTTWVYARPL